MMVMRRVMFALANNGCRFGFLLSLKQRPQLSALPPRPPHDGIEPVYLRIDGAQAVGNICGRRSGRLAIGQSARCRQINRHTVEAHPISGSNRTQPPGLADTRGPLCTSDVMGGIHVDTDCFLHELF